MSDDTHRDPEADTAGPPAEQPETKGFDQYSAMFQALGVARFGAALPEGRIHWLDEKGRVVAHARCEAILSWASGNESVMWARGLPHFREAGVPVVEPDSTEPAYVEGVTSLAAEKLAGDAAKRVDARFFYAAPNPGGVLYLAIHDFRAGGLNADPQAADDRQDSSRAWVLARLQAAEVAAAAGTVVDAAALSDELYQHAEFLLEGLPLATELRGLAQGCAKLPDDPTTQRAMLGAMAGAWSTGITAEA